MREKKKSTLKLIFSYIVIALGIIIVILPIYWAIITSFKNKVDLWQINPLMPSLHPTLKSWIYMFNNKAALQGIKNSSLVSIITVVFSLFIALLAAYGCYRYNFKGRRAFLNSILIMRVLPPAVSVIAFYLMFKSINLTNSIWALVITYPSFILPIMVWLLIGFFIEVPHSIEESARIDGCSLFGSLFKIMIPLAFPGIVATSILALIGVWNEFMIASIISSSYSSATLPVVLAMQSTPEGINYANVATIAVFMMMPLFTFSYFIQKYMARGLTAGAVKE